MLLHLTKLHLNLVYFVLMLALVVFLPVLIEILRLWILVFLQRFLRKIAIVRLLIHLMHLHFL